jgi:hypothetical protein
MIDWLVYGLLGIGYLSLAIGWTMKTFWSASISLLILIPLGLFLVKRKYAPTLGIFFALAVIFAAFGISLHVPLPYAFTGVLCLLAAWDLDDFTRRLAFASPQDNPGSWQQQHLLQLGLVILFGVGACLVVLNIRLKFNFDLAIGLILLIFASLAVLLSWLHKVGH